MQITITQAEIETAIQNYTLGLIAVREDMRIDIDLRATRGEDGYTAVIDITPNDTPPGGEPIPETTPVTKPKAKAKETAAPSAEPAPEAPTEPKAAKPKAAPSIFKKPAPIPQEGPVVSSDDMAPTDPVETPAEASAEPVAADEPAVEQAPVESDAPAPRSIFAGLRKPVNTPKPDTNAA
jgi:hypothetical protein